MSALCLFMFCKCMQMYAKKDNASFTYLNRTFLKTCKMKKMTMSGSYNLKRPFVYIISQTCNKTYTNSLLGTIT